MDRLDRWVSPINILFFVLSGAELDLTLSLIHICKQVSGDGGQTHGLGSA